MLNSRLSLTLIFPSMSILNTLHRAAALARASLTNKLDSARAITFSLTRCSEEENATESSPAETPKVAPRPVVSVETSIQYMNSDAYKQTYGDEPVWKPYKRNHKGLIPPRKTRRTCIRRGQISTGNPCPICRDEYLVLDHRNVKLLEQFINKHNGDVLSYSKTSICQRRHKELLVALTRAKDYGTITYDVPLRHPLLNMDESKGNVEKMESTFVIIGGGIAGVSCAEGLSFLAPEESITLITASPLVKAVTNIVPLGRTLMHFDVEEKSATVLSEKHKMLKVIHDTAVKIDTAKKLVEISGGKIISFKALCLCTGAKPKLIAENSDFVIGIRDTESVLQFSQKLKDARRVIIVGNGGIATEIVHEVKGVEMVWVIKDKHISATFVDPGAAEFFLDKISSKPQVSESLNKNSPTKRMRYVVSDSVPVKNGAALGPDWHNNFDMGGTRFTPTNVQVEYECEISKLLTSDERKQFDSTEEWPIYAQLTNGQIIGCDLIISAIGVIPNSDICGLEDLERGEDAGLLVDWKLETSKKDIYAAGDVCTVGWPKAKHWFQMRLWTQAHQMGRYAAKSMVSNLRCEEFLQDFCFELFTHVTKFFSYKVVLLGLYNGQTLGKNYEILLRITKDQEYVKIILQNGKMQGAVLIGETDLEEMCENLILNQLDLSMYGEDLLDPNIDIEDYFD